MASRPRHGAPSALRLARSIALEHSSNDSLHSHTVRSLLAPQARYYTSGDSSIRDMTRHWLLCAECGDHVREAADAFGDGVWRLGAEGETQAVWTGRRGLPCSRCRGRCRRLASLPRASTSATFMPGGRREPDEKPALRLGPCRHRAASARGGRRASRRGVRRRRRGCGRDGRGRSPFASSRRPPAA